MPRRVRIPGHRPQEDLNLGVSTLPDERRQDRLTVHKGQQSGMRSRDSRSLSDAQAELADAAIAFNELIPGGDPELAKEHLKSMGASRVLDHDTDEGELFGRVARYEHLREEVEELRREAVLKEPASVVVGVEHEIRWGGSFYRLVPTYASLDRGPGPGHFPFVGNRDELVRLLWKRRKTDLILIGPAEDRVKGTLVECLNPDCGRVHRSVERNRRIRRGQAHPPRCADCHERPDWPGQVERGRVVQPGCPRCGCLRHRVVPRDEHVVETFSPARDAKHLAGKDLRRRFNLTEPELRRILRRPSK